MKDNVLVAIGWLVIVFMLVVLVGLLSTCAAPKREIALVPVATTITINNAVASSVSISVSCPSDYSGSGRSGTGVIISPDRVITAYHVVTCTDAAILVTTMEDHVVPMRVEAALVSEDIVRLVSYDNDVFGPVAVKVGPMPMVGDIVCIASAVPARIYRCGRTLALADRGPQNLSYYIETESGNSGSGIYDMQGRLIGVATHLLEPPDGDHKGPVGFGTSLSGLEWISRDWVARIRRARMQ